MSRKAKAQNPAQELLSAQKVVLLAAKRLYFTARIIPSGDAGITLLRGWRENLTALDDSVAALIKVERGL